MSGKSRTLVSTRRLVPPGRRAEYDAAWARLHASATPRGAHAWRFRAAAREDVFLEFLEFAAGDDVRREAEASEALRALDASFGAPPPPPHPTEEWIEIPTPPAP